MHAMHGAASWCSAMQVHRSVHGAWRCSCQPQRRSMLPSRDVPPRPAPPCSEVTLKAKPLQPLSGILGQTYAF